LDFSHFISIYNNKLSNSYGVTSLHQ